MAWIRHDSQGQTTIKNQQALGSASPLETDADGYAEVADEDTAELLVAIDGNVSLSSPPAGGGDEAESTDFDAGSFVDRTPMGDVVEDIETGDYDDHLDAIEAEATRQGVQDAIEARRDE